MKRQKCENEEVAQNIVDPDLKRPVKSQGGFLAGMRRRMLEEEEAGTGSAGDGADRSYRRLSGRVL